MKSLFFQSTFVLLSLAATDGSVKTLEDVYGPIDAVASMSPKMPRSRDAAVLENYKATRLPEDCIFPLDIVIVQDSTDSFTDDYVHMKGTQLPLMVSTLKETHPGSTYGLLSFRDKPITPFGIPPTAENGFYSDYCARIDVPLSDVEGLLPLAYANNPPNGGGDPAENQFHAILGAVQSQGIAWPSGADRAKLLVVVTDAPPHFGSDGSDMQNMTAFQGTFDEADIDGQCVTEFYPEPEQVKVSVTASGAYTAFVIYDPDYLNGLVGRSWLWFNRFLGQTDDFITLQAEDSSDFWSKLSTIVGVIEDIECLPQASTSIPDPPFVTPVESTAIPEPPFVTPVESTAIPEPPSVESTVTPVGTVLTTLPPAVTTLPPAVTDECPECPPCTEDPCPPCPPCPTKDCPVYTKYCQDGVLIKLGQPIDELKVVVNDVEWDV